MGVTGLWPLLEPVGRRIKIEALANKTLAVDASVWLFQFIKAMRDERGELIRNAHLLGFFRRICRLLFHKIRPVFVFDGATPALKKRTTIARRRRREQQDAKLRKTAEKLLLNQLKQHTLAQLQAAGGPAASPKAPSAGGRGGGRADGKGARGGSAGAVSGHAPKRRRTGEQQQQQGAGEAGGKGEESDGGPAPPNPLAGLPRSPSPGPANPLAGLPRAAVDAVTAAAALAVAFDEDQPGTSQSHAAAAVAARAAEAGGGRRRGGPPSTLLDEMMAAQLAAEEWEDAVPPAGGSAGPAPGEVIDLDVNGAGTEGGEGAGSDDEEVLDLEMLVPADGELDPEVLSTLPPSMQLEIIMRARDQRMATNREKFEARSGAPASFSQFQLQQYLKSSQIRRQVEAVRTAVNTAAAGGEAARRIAAEEGREYVLTKDAEAAPEVAPAGSPQQAQQQGAAAGAVEEVLDISFEVPLQLGLDSSGVGSGDEEEWEDVAGSAGAAGAAQAAAPIDPRQLHWRQRAAQRQRYWSLSHGFQKGRALADWGKEAEPQPAELAGGVVGEEDAEFQAAIAESLREQAAAAARQGHPLASISEEASGEFEWEDTEPGFAEPASRQQQQQQQQQEEEEALAEPDNTGMQLAERAVVVVDLTTSPPRPPPAAGEAAPAPAALVAPAVPAAEQPAPARHEAVTMSAPAAQPAQAAAPAALVAGSKAPAAAPALGQGAPVVLAQPPEDVEVWEDVPAAAPHSSEPPSLAQEERPAAGLPAPAAQPSSRIPPQGLSTTLRADAAAAAGGMMPSCAPPTEERLPAKPAVATAEPAPTRAAAAEGLQAESVAAAFPSTRVEAPPVQPAAAGGWEEEAWEDVDWEALEQSQQQPQEQQHPAGGGAGQAPLQDAAAAAPPPAPFPDLTAANLGAHMSNLQREEQRLRFAQRAQRGQSDAPTSEMYAEVQELLQMFGLPYIIAPQEAESQCAWLDAAGLVEGVVTDDNDVFLFGGQRVYRNIFSSTKFVEEFYTADIERELGLGREKLVLLALLLGSDYTPGISGVGIVNAVEIVNAFPTLERLRTFRDWVEAPADDLLDLLSQQQQQGGGGRGKAKGKASADGVPSVAGVPAEFASAHKTLKKSWELPDGFPDAAVVEAYAQPRVDAAKDKFTFGRPDLELLRIFCEECFSWPTDKADELLLPVLSAYDARQAQQTIDAFLSHRERFAKIKSKRLQKALHGIKPNLDEEVLFEKGGGGGGEEEIEDMEAVEAEALALQGDHPGGGEGEGAAVGVAGGKKLKGGGAKKKLPPRKRKK